MSESVEIALHPKQQDFINAALSGTYRHLFYGGAQAGGKTVVLCILTMMLCRIYPGSRWALVRKDLPRLRRNLIPTWNRFAPPRWFGVINQGTWSAKCVNGSEVLFIPASEPTDPNHDRVRGLELNGAMIDECNEISEEFASILGSRCGRWPCKGKPPILMCYTANPNQQWPKHKFFTPWANKTLAAPYFYIPAYVTDNPALSPEYVAALKDLPPKMYRMLVEGDWSIADDPDQLISGTWVEDAFAREPRTDLVLPPRLGVDPARFGDDSTAIARTVNYHIAQILLRQKIDTHEGAAIVQRMAVDHKIHPRDIRVDVVGLGAGVADALKRVHGMSATPFSGGAAAVNKGKPGEFFTFRNLRSEAFWHLRECFKEGWISVDPSVGQVERLKLQGDLTSMRYSVDGDKMIAVEPKDQIKKRLGRSPDVGDAVSMALAEMRKPITIVTV